MKNALSTNKLALKFSGVVALGAILGLSACASTPVAAPPTSTAKPITTAECVTQGSNQLNVSYTKTSTPSVGIAKAALEKKYPGLTVNAVLSSAANYTEMGQQIVADKAAGKNVDVAQVGNDQVRLFVDTYGLKPFDMSVLPTTYDKQYLPAGQIKGKQYAIPFQVSLPGMYINKDAFTKAGLNPEEPPTTIAELLKAARKLKATLGDQQIIGINGGPSSDDFFLQAFVQSYGGTFTADDGTAAFNTKAGVDALNFFSTTAKEGLLMHKTDVETAAAFESGQLPILIQSTASVQNIDTAIGPKFQWDISLMPTTSKPSFTAGGNSLISLSDNACTTKLSDEFIADMVKPDALGASLKSYTYQPVDTSVQAAMLASNSTNPKAKEMLGVSTKLVARGAWPGTHTPEVQKIIADMVEQIVAGQDVKVQLTSAVQKIDGVVR